MDQTSYLLLYDRRGQIREWVLVDSADYEELRKYRWHLNSTGYAYRDAGEIKRGYKVGLHRHLLGLKPGDGLEVDHKNRNRRDNRRQNLRLATGAQNAQNQSKSAGRSSRYRGVSWHKHAKQWEAYLMVRGTFYRLGYFKDEEEAAAVVAAKRKLLMSFATD
jgi:hypothetical protein